MLGSFQVIGDDGEPTKLRSIKRLYRECRPILATNRPREQVHTRRTIRAWHEGGRRLQ
jgi:hypothetical protein